MVKQAELMPTWILFLSGVSLGTNSGLIYKESDVSRQNPLRAVTVPLAGAQNSD
jgi:hypothetical protein